MVSKGLEDVVALSSRVCSIIHGVLTYRGYHIDDLAENSHFEEVAYLLWNDRLPTQQELDQLKQDLDRYAPLPEGVMEQIKLFPHTGHMMAALRTAVSLLSLYDERAERMTAEANYQKAIQLTAQIPTLIAAIYRLRQGLEPISPRKGIGFAANFLYMLDGEVPTPVAAKALDKVLILQADHELNASTFAGRVTAGTLTDIYSSVTAAIGALKGPLHGGANEQVAEMLQEIGRIENTEAYIRDKFARKEKIMGFGHRVYKDGDPRAKHLRTMAQRLAEQNGDTTWYDMSVEIEQLVYQHKPLKPNVDFYSATVYLYLGMSSDLFTPMFAMSRISGWTAHILEQYADNRLIRPRAEYLGENNQPYVPIQQRG